VVCGTLASCSNRPLPTPDHYTLWVNPPHHTRTRYPPTHPHPPTHHPPPGPSLQDVQPPPPHHPDAPSHRVRAPHGAGGVALHHHRRARAGGVDGGCGGLLRAACCIGVTAECVCTVVAGHPPLLLAHAHLTTHSTSTRHPTHAPPFSTPALQAGGAPHV